MDDVLDATVGERLAGGNVGGAWRVRGTVRRATGPWTPAVHALLRHLRGRLDAVPAVYGVDELGRESLSFMRGRIVDIDAEVLTTGQLASLAGWTRRLHAAVAGFSHDGPWRAFAVDEPTLVGHNDLGSYNLCFDGDRLAGVFDWDLAGPTTPRLELAFVAWNGVPLWDATVRSHRAAERLQVLADAYGGPSALQVLDAVPSRVRLMLDGIPRAAAAGDAGMVNLLRVGEPQRSQRTLDALVARLPAIRQALA